MVNSNFVGCSTGRSADCAFQNLVYLDSGRRSRPNGHAIAHKPTASTVAWLAYIAGSRLLPRVRQSLSVSRHEPPAAIIRTASARPYCGSECGLNILGLRTSGIEASLSNAPAASSTSFNDPAVFGLVELQRRHSESLGTSPSKASSRFPLSSGQRLTSQCVPQVAQAGDGCVANRSPTAAMTMES